MRVRSSTIESHHFTVVRRRGYDPAEVDAAMGRLANTLREYEALANELEVKLREADDASEAIHRTFVAAQRTRDEMIADAKKEGANLLDAARAQADEIIGETGTQIDVMLAKAAADADSLYAAATATQANADEDAARVRSEANEILEIAKAKTESARAQADEVLTSAIADAEAKSEEANHVLSNHHREAETTLRDAAEEGARLTADARAEAERVAATASADAAATTAASRREAETLIASALSETKELRTRVKAEVDELRTTRRAKAEALVTVAENEAEEIRSKAVAGAAALVSQTNVRTEELLSKAKTDAAERVSAAQSQSDEILDRAQGRAEEIVEEARRDKERLDRRAAQLRTAVADIERELRKLTETTLERTGMIGEIIDLEHRTIDLTGSTSDPAAVAEAAGSEAADSLDPDVEPRPDPVPSGGGDSPAALTETTETDTVGGPVGLAAVIKSTDAFASLTRRRSELEALARLVRARTVAFAEPDGSGRPPAARRLLDPETTRRASDPSETIYQRRARGLRARLREEGQDPTQRGR